MKWVHFAVGEEQLPVASLGWPHQVVGLHLFSGFLLLLLFNLFLLILVLPLLVFLPLLVLAVVLPVRLVLLLHLGLVLVVLDDHLDGGVLDAVDVPVLLVLEDLLELAREVVVLQVLVEALLGLHEAVTLVRHVLPHSLARPEILGILVLAGNAQEPHLDLLLQVLD